MILLIERCVDDRDAYYNEHHQIVSHGFDFGYWNSGVVGTYGGYGDLRDCDIVARLPTTIDDHCSAGVPPGVRFKFDSILQCILNYSVVGVGQGGISMSLARHHLYPMLPLSNNTLPILLLDDLRYKVYDPT